MIGPALRPEPPEEEEEPSGPEDEDDRYRKEFLYQMKRLRGETSSKKKAAKKAKAKAKARAQQEEKRKEEEKTKEEKKADIIRKRTTVFDLDGTILYSMCCSKGHRDSKRGTVAV